MIAIDRDSLQNVMSYCDLPSALAFIEAMKNPELTKLFKQATFWQEMHQLYPQRPGKLPAQITQATDYYKSEEWDRLIRAFGPVAKNGGK